MKCLFLASCCAIMLSFVSKAEAQEQNIFLLNPLTSIEPGAIYDISTGNTRGKCLTGRLDQKPRKVGIQREMGSHLSGLEGGVYVGYRPLGSIGVGVAQGELQEWMYRWENTYSSILENVAYSGECWSLPIDDLKSNKSIYYITAVHKSDKVEYLVGESKQIQAASKASVSLPIGLGLEAYAKSGVEVTKLAYGKQEDVYFRITISKDWPKRDQIECDYDKLCKSILSPESQFVVKRAETGVIVIFPLTNSLDEMRRCTTDLVPTKEARRCIQRHLWMDGLTVDFRRDDKPLRLTLIKSDGKASFAISLID